MQWTDIISAVSNLAMVLITIVLIILGWYQLTKLRESNNLQALEGLYNNFISESFIKMRKQLSKFIEEFQFEDKVGFEALKIYLNSQILSHRLDDNIAKVKNAFENVIFVFEKIGYYSLDKKIYSVRDVYELFFYEIENYWCLVNSIGYINYLRENKFNGEEYYYSSFERLYFKIITQEVIYHEKKLGFFGRRKYNRMAMQKIKLDDMCNKQITKIEDFNRTLLFLKEEF